MTPRQNRRRKRAGNVLVITCVGLAILAILLLVGYSFSGLYFEHNRLQTSADEIALTGAKKLNYQDRIGQMNNMITRCRQLVYSTRDDYNNVKKDYPKLEPFADQLLKEARQSAFDLDNERKKLRTVAEDESVQAMHDKFDAIKGTYQMVLPWMRVKTPRVISVGLGRMTGVESNVEEFPKFDQLKQYDRDRGYIAQFDKLNLYKANQNEQLKDDDNDLPFFLTSLPAPLDNMVSPARTTLATNYVEANDELVPTATQVMLDLRVENGFGASGNAGIMQAKSTAITTGASSQD